MVGLSRYPFVVDQRGVPVHHSSIEEYRRINAWVIAGL